MAKELEKHLENFVAETNLLGCTGHVFNLAAQVIALHELILLFNKFINKFIIGWAEDVGGSAGRAISV